MTNRQLFSSTPSVKHLILRGCLILLLGFGALLTAQAKTIFVKANAGGTNNGTSWANAYTSLQTALASAVSSDVLWVAKGTYKPSSIGNRGAAFVMLPNVNIYGSFEGIEANLSDRTPSVRAANPSILSGDLSGNDVITGSGSTLSITNNADNSFHVVFNNNNALTTTNALLDGFTITGGNANGSSPNDLGGGMLNNISSPSLSNVTFSGNNAGGGGGLLNFNASSPSLSNVTFSNNNAVSGGGMYNNASSPILSNVTFSGNNATNGGGMLNNASSSSSLSNVTFSGNYAEKGGGMDNLSSSPILSKVTFGSNNAIFGGGMYNSSSSPSLSNVTFSSNYADGGGGMSNDNSSSPSLSNVIFSGNNAFQGGGMYNFTCALSLSNVTFSGNNASSGSGVYNVASFLIIKNSIFWGNQQGSSAVVGDDIYNNANSTTTITNTALQLVSSSYGSDFPSITTGNNLFAQDPLLLNAANPAGSDGKFGTSDDGLALTACSPVLNAGNNTGVATTDIVGNPRIFGSTVDMGAYELQAAPQYYPIPATTTNNALNFDGTNDYVEITNCNTALTNTDALTIEYWFKGASNHSAVRLQPDNNSYIIAGYISGATGLHLVRLNNVPYSIATGNATDGNWHHVAMTWQRNTTNGFKSYLDGALVAQTNTPNTALPVITSGIWLGSYLGTQQFSVGALDEVRVWGVARTQAQIQAGRNPCTFTLPQTGLVVYYKFDHGSGGGANTAINTMVNSANTATFPSLLHNFTLTGANSNWISNSCAVLPIELLDFKGTPQYNGNFLTWTTANEVNNKGCQIERASPQPPKGALTTWESIGFVNAKGKAATYEFLDAAPPSGAGGTYYRLRQIDNDGTESISKIVSIQNTPSGRGLKIYPSIATNYLNIETDLTDNFTIINTLGQVQMTGKISNYVDINALPKGLYVFKTGQAQAKFVKQ
jgi:hypothetical protein